jgi:ankyrin repeat protein
MDRRQKFKSSPLHLACIGGNVRLVKGLLAAGSKFNTPDATGSFPIHIACSGLGQGLGTLQAEETVPTTDDIQRSVSERNRDNDTRRTECVQHLLNAGAPLAMKDGNKQTVFHCAARSGNCPLIRFLMRRLDPATNNDVTRHGWLFNWHDRWFRTPVHWAILNGHVEALNVLLDSGCNPNPNMPKASRSNRHTSADIETPLELCLRLYGNEEGTMGSNIVNLLKQRK